MSKDRDYQVCLCMIVKDEEKNIVECLDSIRHLIDRWVIVDTGSSDKTKELIEEYFEKYDIPGQLYERPWKHFGHNRTEAIQYCGQSPDEFIFVIDADDRVIGNLQWPKRLDNDCYDLKFKVQGNNEEFIRRQLFKADANWIYVGPIHEEARCHKQNPTLAKLEGDYYILARQEGGGRNQQSLIEKFSKDAEFLEKYLEENPNDTRSLYYLGQSYFDSKQWQKAIEVFENRVKRSGAIYEMYLSFLKMAQARIRIGGSFTDIKNNLESAYACMTDHAEPLLLIARLFNANKKGGLAYLYAKHASTLPFPVTPIACSPSVYEWQCHFEVAKAALIARRYQEGYESAQIVLNSSGVPEETQQQVRQLIEQYKERLGKTNANT